MKYILEYQAVYRYNFSTNFRIVLISIIYYYFSSIANHVYYAIKQAIGNKIQYLLECSPDIQIFFH